MTIFVPFHAPDSSYGTHRYWRAYFPSNGGWGFTILRELVFSASVGGPDIPGGTVISGGSGADAIASPATAARDGDPNTQWARSSSTNTWIGVDYGAGNEQTIVEARLTGPTIASAGADTASWTSPPASAILQYSDDNVTWTTAITATYGDTWVAGGTRSLPEATPAEGFYRCWRVYLNGSNGASWVTIFEMEFRETVSGADILPPISGVTPVQGMDGTIDGRPIGLDEFLFNPFSKPYVGFNDDFNDYFFAHAAVGPIGCIFPDPVKIEQIALGIGRDSDFTWAPNSFDIQGSNDNVNWTTLRSYTGQTAWTPYVFNEYLV